MNPKRLMPQSRPRLVNTEGRISIDSDFTCGKGEDLQALENSGKAAASTLRVSRFAARALAANMRYVSTR